MPFFVMHDTQLAPLADMAASSGSFATSRILDQDAQQRAAFQQRQRLADTSAAESMARMVLDDIQQQDRIGAQERMLGQRGEQGLQRADLQGQYGLARQTAANQGRVEVAGMNNDTRTNIAGMNVASREGIAGANRDLRQGIADMQNGLGYDRLRQGYDQQQQQQEIQQKRLELQQQKINEDAADRRMQAAEQQARYQNRAADAQRLALMRAQLTEWRSQRGILEQRATQGDPAAPAYIDQINQQIRQALQGQQQQPPPQMAAPGAQQVMAPAPDMNAMMAAQAPQPQPQVPRQIQDAGGRVWVFTGQFDPATGEPLYQER